jgi:hypothetical protein
MMLDKPIKGTTNANAINSSTALGIPSRCFVSHLIGVVIHLITNLCRGIFRDEVIAMGIYKAFLKKKG